MQMSAFPINLLTPVTHHGPLPDRADCVVIGGGVIGVSTALYLNRAGRRVVLLEKGRIAGEQSSRNWGWVRAQGRDPDELPIMVEAHRLWREIAAQVDCDIGLRQGGVLYLARSEAEVASYEAWMPYARAADLDTRMLGRAEVTALLPAAHRPWAGAIFTPSDMRAEPWRAVPALARLAASEGVTIVENCAARTIERTAGSVSAVATEAGRVATGEVVVAGGAWSSLLLRTLGIAIPQLSVRATVAATAPMAEVFGGGAVDSALAFRRREDGGYTLAPAAFHEMFIGPDAFRALPRFFRQLAADPFGSRYLPAAPKGYPDAWRTPRHWSAAEPSPFERMRILDPSPNAGVVRKLVREMSRIFPDLGPMRIQAAWAGMIDVMPDLVPVVDRVNALPGLTISTGMSGHGFGIGPAFGRITAALVAGTETGHDLSRFRLSRFSDGSPTRLGPTL